MTFTVPLYFQVTQRSTSTAVGARLFPAVAGNAVGGIVSGYLIRRLVESWTHLHVYQYLPFGLGRDDIKLLPLSEPLPLQPVISLCCCFGTVRPAGLSLYTYFQGEHGINPADPRLI